VIPRRLPGGGWLALVGGGEFTFEETLDADSAWMEKVAESGHDGPIGFIPAASGSSEYGDHFAQYMTEVFDREAIVIPIYRPRDGRRAKNAERIDECAAVYLGGGVTDHLLDALAPSEEPSPAAEALLRKLGQGGVVVAIAAAAQALGVAAKSFRPGRTVAGLGWLPGGVVEPNFDPEHDRRLRRLLQAPGASWGVGLAAGSCLLLGPGEAVETVGEIRTLDHPEGDLETFEDEVPSS
jgi:cyanophycinase-like exopeptidase